MVEAFVSTKFFLSVASKMNYDDGIVFTENNIVAYLAELEEYIGSLITYMAFKRDDPNAATSAIPLAQLNEKKFNQRDLEVSPCLNHFCQLSCPSDPPPRVTGFLCPLLYFTAHIFAVDSFADRAAAPDVLQARRPCAGPGAAGGSPAKRDGLLLHRG